MKKLLALFSFSALLVFGALELLTPQPADAGLITIAGGRGVASTPPVGDSDLAQLSSTMSSGDWASFTMGGLNDTLLHANAGSGTLSCVVYTHGGVWNPVSKKVVYLGFSHTADLTLSNAGCYLIWDDATNTWTRPGSYNYTTGDNTGHTYFHVAVKPSTNETFWRMYGSGVLRKYVGPGTGSQTDWRTDWETGHATDIAFGSTQITGCLKWWPEINSGQGGMFFADTVGWRYSNNAISSWTSTMTSIWSGDYDTNCANAGGFMYWGGGTCYNADCSPQAPSDRNRDFYRISTAGVVQQRADLPAAASQNSQGAGILLEHPNGDDLLLLQMNAGANTYLYTAATDSWSVYGVNEFTEDILHMCTSVPDYDVVVCVTHGGTQSTAYAQVWKP